MGTIDGSKAKAITMTPTSTSANRVITLVPATCFRRGARLQSLGSERSFPFGPRCQTIIKQRESFLSALNV